MSQARKERFLHLVSQARSNPQLAHRVAAQLPEQLRLAFLDELARPAAPPAPSANLAKTKPAGKARPGLRKCDPTTANGFSTQLNMFARSVSRVS
jgi:hypothetical protein